MQASHELRELSHNKCVFDIHMCALQGRRHDSDSMVGHCSKSSVGVATCGLSLPAKGKQAVKRPASDCHANERLAMVSGLCSTVLSESVFCPAMPLVVLCRSAALPYGIGHFNASLIALMLLCKGIKSQLGPAVMHAVSKPYEYYDYAT